MTALQRSVLFGGYCLGVGLAHQRVLRALYEHATHDETASHAILIPFVTCGLIALRRKAIFESVQTAWRGGIGVILGGVSLLLVSAFFRPFDGPGESLTLAVGALIVLWIGGFVLLFGRQASRAAMFPLLFLGLMTPFPNVVIAGVTEILKNGSTEGVAGLFTLTGTPYYREGYVFALPRLVIEVADACSGIRSSIGLLLTGLLAGHVFLDTAWKKAVLVLVIVPISIAKNAIRIVSLSLLAIHVDPEYLTGQLHHEGGVVFFLLALAMLEPILFLLYKSEPRHRKPMGEKKTPVIVATAGRPTTLEVG